MGLGVGGHAVWVGHVGAEYTEAGGGAIGREFCGTGISSRSCGNGKTAERLADNPRFLFADAERKGYGVVDLSPRQLTTTLRVVDDVRRPVTAIETLATFTVEAGRNVVERA